MADALTAPLALAALVLCVAGAAKLRSPHAAVDALATLGVAPPVALVRVFALVELGLGAWCVARPSAAAAGALGCIYLAFAVLGLVLARQRSPCGCFGSGQQPASSAQALLSAALAAVAGAAAIWGTHGASWLWGRPALSAAALTVGLAGGVYATVIAYTELPLAWSAWRGGSR